MADQLFTTWPFASTTGGFDRTQPDRLDDYFNVKDFGALGDGFTNDQPAIQAAVTATQAAGGTVYFPHGKYIVTSRILVSGPSSKGIRFLGCGGSDPDSPGSILYMPAGGSADYIIYCMHGNVGGGGMGDTVTMIEGLTFVQKFNGSTPTTTEPPNSPDIYCSITAAISGTGGNIRLSLSNAAIITNAFIIGQSVIISGVTGTNSGVNGTWSITQTGTTTGTAWIEVAFAWVSGTSTGTVTFNGNGCGCLYMSGMIGNVVRDCTFHVQTGIGIYYPGFRNCIENLTVTGSYAAAGDDINKSIGVFTRGSSIRGGKWTSLSTAVCIIMGQSNVDFMDIERGGVGLRAGINPIQHWESNANDLWPAGTNCSVSGCSISSFTMESMGDTAIWLYKFSGGLKNIAISSFNQIGIPDYGLKIEDAGASGSEINVAASGAFNVAAIDASGIVDCVLTCNATQTGGSGVPWILPTNLVSNCTSGVQFKNCNIDGALAFSLFVTPPAINGYEMMCSDSTIPAWDTGSSASNVGKPIVGSGSYRVLARYTEIGRLAATASWTTADATLTVTANPGFVVPGMGVWDQTNNTSIGIVSTFVSSSTALVLTLPAHTASSGSADVLAFGNWCIAG